MYRSLRPSKIVETCASVQRRIAERFPDSGLARVAAEVHQIANEAVTRADRFRRPNVPLRLGIGLLVLGILAVLVGVALQLRVKEDLTDVEHFAQFLESTLGSIVFIGAAILFLVTLEIRLKRNRALTALHELRSLAHIIDMHQLTKDPERLLHRGPATASSPQTTMTPYELGRYLDYCSELLSIISKIAALYVQDFPDPVALDTVDQVENMTNGLSRKIWQKIMIMERLLGGAAKDV